MNKPGVPNRSRRRRASLALFGRSRQRTAMTEILHMPVERWWYDKTVIETTPNSGVSESFAPTHEADRHHEAELQALVSRLQKDARTDLRLCANLAIPELDRLIDGTVRALWAESRVTAFVPLLAMRRIHEELGLADQSGEPNAARLDA